MRYGIALACAVILVSAGPVWARAGVVSSDPKAGDVLASAPDTVTITFSETLRPHESRIWVYNSVSQLQNKGMKVYYLKDGATLSAELPPLPNGTYRVRWKAVSLSASHDATNGTFSFTVRHPVTVR